MSAGSEEQQAMRVLALGEQIHLRSPLTLAVPDHPNRLGVQSPLSLRIYVRNHRRVVDANQYMLLFQLWLKIL